MASHFCRIFLIALFLCQGCGPITASSKISDAREQIVKAAQVEAPKYAPFEYQGALLYLEKAREEEGYAYYQDSVTLAKKAFGLAVDAQRLAQQRKAEEIAEAAKKAAEQKEAEAKETEPKE